MVAYTELINKHAGETALIFGAGTSLLDFPLKWDLPNTRAIAMNSSVIAPHFYDYPHKRLIRKWDYVSYLDKLIFCKDWFPETFYRDVSLAEHDVPKLLAPNIPRLKNEDKLTDIVRTPPPTVQGAVLGVTLEHCKNMGFANIVLIGCDFCRRQHRRYWFELHPIGRDPRFRREIVTHIEPAKVPDFMHKKYEPAPEGGMLYIKNRRGITRTAYPKYDTGGNVVHMDDMYARQFGQLQPVFRMVQEAGINLYKYGNVGMLPLPYVTYDSLQALLRTGHSDDNQENS